MSITRRQSLAALAGSAALALGAAPPVFDLCSFSAEVTVPLGHPLMGGGVQPAKAIDDPLFAKGFVFRAGGKPIVVAIVDWCEIRNDAYTLWRQSLAKAAGTTPDRVLVSSIHQHDTPIADLEAERLLRAAKVKASVCDLDFHDKAVARVARAVRESAKSPRRVTHIGTGRAKVEKVASNRRYLTTDNRIAFDRTSATRNALAREAPENLIDPDIRTLSFWDDDTPLLALSVYAVHPMSYYGRGGVSADFVGLARKLRQAEQRDVAILYGSGASGNVVAGKYNDGDPGNRPVLADRILQGMRTAWKATTKKRITQVAFRSIPYTLKPRDGGEFALEAMKKRLKEDKRTFGQCLAALGLSWRKRCDAGHQLDLPAIDFGSAQLLLLPGESYVEFQLAAQKMRPDSFVVSLGYGECAPGYVPTEKAVKENDGNLRDWCWVAPGAEKALTEALRKGLAK